MSHLRLKVFIETLYLIGVQNYFSLIKIPHRDEVLKFETPLLGMAYESWILMQNRYGFRLPEFIKSTQSGSSDHLILIIDLISNCSNLKIHYKSFHPTILNQMWTYLQNQSWGEKTRFLSCTWCEMNNYSQILPNKVY